MIMFEDLVIIKQKEVKQFNERINLKAGEDKNMQKEKSKTLLND